MQVTLIVDGSAFEKALRAAEALGLEKIESGMNAPVDGALTGRVQEAWESVRKALERVYRMGVDAARPAIEAAEETIDRVLTEAGRSAGEVALALRAKLRQYVMALVDGMLAQIRAELPIGGRPLQLTEVKLSQKLVVGGSLKASLAEVVALTGNSELVVDATYRAPTAG